MASDHDDGKRPEVNMSVDLVPFGTAVRPDVCLYGPRHLRVLRFFDH